MNAPRTCCKSVRNIDTWPLETSLVQSQKVILEKPVLLQIMQRNLRYLLSVNQSVV